MQDIKKIVNYYKRKYNTSDPFELADRLNILYQFGDLKYEGCYMFLKNHRYIFLNQNLSYHDKQLVMAHELGSCTERKTVILYEIKHCCSTQKMRSKPISLQWNY